jgi:ferredoxin-NADP reductase
MNYIVKVLKTGFVTHNVKHFVVEKPKGYTFVPGQATDVAVNKPGLENELRPFTFTCLPNSDHLEFIIKIYTGHRGMTENLLQVKEGDEFILHDVFGTIHFEGPGLFIAAGAGITPFISIFRHLKEQNKLHGNTLLFANRTENDVILKSELEQMLEDHYVDVIEIPSSGGIGKRIDGELLQQHLSSKKQYYYVCGPDKFTAIMVEMLMGFGVEKSQIIIEQ